MEKSIVDPSLTYMKPVILKHPIVREYNFGYIDHKGWFGYIPPRHKKRIQKYLKDRNKGLNKNHYKYLHFSDMIEIKKYTTVMYA